MSNVKNKATSILLIISLLTVMIGFVNVDKSYAAKKIHLAKTSVSLIKGKTFQQKLIDKKGRKIKAKKVKWKSKNSFIAKINKKGKITAVKAGKTKMTAKYKKKTYNFTVYVKGVTVKKPTLSPKKPAPSPIPDYNSSIKFELSEITVAVGQTKKVKVTTDRGYSIVYKTSNNKVGCQWGDWLSGTTSIYLSIRGNTEGISNVVVYDNKKNNISTNLTVNVVSGAKYMHDYVNSNGYTNKNGEKTIKFDLTIDSENKHKAYFIAHDDSLQMLYFGNNNLIDLTFNLHSNILLYPIVTIGQSEADATLIPSSYTKSSTTLQFYYKDGSPVSIDTLNKLFNATLRTALAGWNLAIYSLTNIKLNSFGFDNY